jgi:bacterioferritin-associated ferredoxin
VDQQIAAFDFDQCLDPIGRSNAPVIRDRAMIICSCHALSDHEVRDAVTDGSPSRKISDVYRRLGRIPECGRCVRAIQDILAERVEDGVFV